MSTATARFRRFRIERPSSRTFRTGDCYWLDMCLTPRPDNARGCYAQHWGPHRYERIGEIFLVPPEHALHILSDGPANQMSIVCEIKASAVGRWLSEGSGWTSARLAGALDIAQPHMRACLFRLAEEARTPGLGSRALASALVDQLAIEVARYCEATADDPARGGLAAWRLRLVKERVAGDDAPPTLAELAGICGMSARQLTRGFRSSTGMTIGEYVSQAMIDRAKRLLDTPRSIAEIAFLLGFGSSSSFGFAFRKATGSTPRQFRTRQLRTRQRSAALKD
ncbi:helix-turn-helix transcriptional regulator [Sphingomonas tabacisoli]|uniref:Helix-turn-helix transcriptional regulator n=1 Tax=Sphingomonas tabacisoli TaxID=2249466 RepID=A0ABW4I7D6_9SPHN